MQGLREAILERIELLPEDKLTEAFDFIDFLKEKYGIREKKVVSLEGIWKGKISKDVDIEEEIKSLRDASRKKLDEIRI